MEIKIITNNLVHNSYGSAIERNPLTTRQTERSVHFKPFLKGSTTTLSYSESSSYFTISTFILLLMAFISIFKFSCFLPFKVQPLFSIIFSTLFFRYFPAFSKNQSRTKWVKRLANFFLKSLSSVLLFVFLLPLVLYSTSSSLNCWNIQFNDLSNSKFSQLYCVLLMH